jgi:hypothetical protein
MVMQKKGYAHIGYTDGERKIKTSIGERSEV